MNTVASNTGFTIIEAIVVIALISLLAALAGLGLSGLRDRAHFEDAIKTVETSVAEARRLAKSRDSDTLLSVFAEDGVWKVQVGAAEKEIKRAEFSDSFSIVLEAPYGTAVYPSGSTAEVDVSLGERRATVHVVGVLGSTVVTR